MKNVVIIDKKTQKKFTKIPKYIMVLFDIWVEIIENDGFREMQKIKGYRDHALKGERQGQRSSSLNRSWRVIYLLDENNNLLIVEVLEVNHHEY